MKTDDAKSDMFCDTLLAKIPVNSEPNSRKFMKKETFEQNLQLARKQFGGNYEKRIKCKETIPSLEITTTLTIPAPPLGPNRLAINATTSTRPPPQMQAYSAAIPLSPSSQSEHSQGQLHSRASSDWSAPLMPKPLDKSD